MNHLHLAAVCLLSILVANPCTAAELPEQMKEEREVIKEIERPRTPPFCMFQTNKHKLTLTPEVLQHLFFIIDTRAHPTKITHQGIENFTCSFIDNTFTAPRDTASEYMPPETTQLLIQAMAGATLKQAITEKILPELHKTHITFFFIQVRIGANQITVQESYRKALADLKVRPQSIIYLHDGTLDALYLNHLVEQGIDVFELTEQDETSDIVQTLVASFFTEKLRKHSQSIGR
ncbi:MAG: hypothetical protein H6679_02760 [Epsilonproteobacteria bacterium]|nr:hypothetical protein [Campylobacterota bacterium]